MENWVCEYGKPDMAVGVAHVSTAPGMYGDIATVWSVRGNAEEVGNLLSSAPDLLKALELFVEEYVELVESGDAGYWNAENENKVKLARAAISKAKGEMK